MSSCTRGPGGRVASNVAEVEAESVAYVVCQAAGMATTEYSLPTWPGGPGATWA